MQLERPIMFGALKQVQQRLGTDRFPLIEQNYYSHWSEVKFTPNYPIVVKVGHTHAGFGKIKVPDNHVLDDLGSVLALHNDYAVAEPFLKGTYDQRIQKIGDRVRCYKRTGFNSWKTNTGTAVLEEIPVTEEHMLWVNECAKLFGGLDWFALDTIHDEATDKDYILELNGTSIGLGPEREDEDNRLIRGIALRKLRGLNSTSEHKEADASSMTPVSESKRVSVLEVENLNLQNDRGALRTELQDVKKELAEVQSEKAVEILQLQQQLHAAVHQRAVVDLGALRRYLRRNPMLMVGALLLFIALFCQVFFVGGAPSRPTFLKNMELPR